MFFRSVRVSALLLFSLFLTFEAANADYSEPSLLKESEAVFNNPHSMALTPEGTFLLVADTGNNEIKILQPGTLKILSQFGKDTLSGPAHIEFGKDGFLNVFDKGLTRITSYDFKGVLRDGKANVDQIGQHERQKTKMPATNIVTDVNSLTFRTNSDTNRVLIFDNLSKQISEVGEELNLINPMDVESVGRYFWILDSGNNRVLLLKAPRKIGQ